MPANAEESGILACPEGPAIAYRRRAGGADLPGLVFLGGFRSDMTGQKAAMLDELAAVQGRSFLRFDYRGHGASEGAFEDAVLGDWIADAISAFDQLTSGPQIVVGSSMGGWIMQHLALVRPSRVAALVGIAVATDFTRRLIRPALTEPAKAALARDGFIRVPSAYDPAGYVLTSALIEDGDRHSLLGEGAIPIRFPVRLIHGMVDAEVPWQHGLETAQALESRDLRLILVKDGDHRLSRPQDLALLAETITSLDDSLLRGR